MGAQAEQPVDEDSALRSARRVAIELKESYFKQACKYISAEDSQMTMALADAGDPPPQRIRPVLMFVGLAQFAHAKASRYQDGRYRGQGWGHALTNLPSDLPSGSATCPQAKKRRKWKMHWTDRLAIAVIIAGSALLAFSGIAGAVVPDIFWWLWR